MTATRTSIDAYHGTARNFEGGQMGRIMDHIRTHGGDWSIGEIAKALHMEKSTVSARVNKLIEVGSLEAKPHRKDRVSGVTVRPVGLPAKQLGLDWPTESEAPISGN